MQKYIKSLKDTEESENVKWKKSIKKLIDFPFVLLRWIGTVKNVLFMK